MATYELTFHAVEPVKYGKPMVYAKFERFNAANLPEAIEQMNEILELERYFHPVIFGNFKLVSDKLENILPKIS